MKFLVFLEILFIYPDFIRLHFSVLTDVKVPYVIF